MELDEPVNEDATLDYTVATKADDGLHAYSCAEWSNNAQVSGELRRAFGRDSISVSAQKSGLSIVDSRFSANTRGGSYLPSSRYSQTDLSYTSLIYDFKEKADIGTIHFITKSFVFGG